jgi:hypothetical protein
MYQDKIHNPILNRPLSPGEEIRGNVGFELVQSAESLMLFLKYPDWRIAGQVAIPEVMNGTSSITNRDYQKNLKLFVHSAVLKTSIPGFTASPGNRLAVINVSITNENPTDAVITSENLLILTEQGITFEHGGSHTTKEIAKNFLYLPLTIKPGETISGPMFYSVKGGSRINKLVVTDKNLVFNSMVDLNNLYQYE